MEELTELNLLRIESVKPKEYLLTFNVNGEKKVFTANIDMVEPMFGVNFSDDFIYILRNYRSDIQKLIKMLENLYYGKKVDLPTPVLKEETLPELQTA